ncbi:MAG: hypothetical protein PUB20_03340 [Clostridia bacterium]|nr:hypothetical protein [Clostridia bacterium]
MKAENKLNKRRKSCTEFRTSYSDNKKYFISTDKQKRGMSVLKYIIIAAFMLVIAFVSFIVTDAVLEISEAPYNAEETSTTKQYIDEKYFENQVTVKADEITDNAKESID